MNCDHYIELISECLDGVISPENKRELAAHLSECAECRAFAELMQAAHSELEDMAVEPPATLVSGVMEAVAAERHTTGARHTPTQKKRWIRYGALAAAVAVVVLAVYAIPRGTRSSNMVGQSAKYVSTDAAQDTPAVANAKAEPEFYLDTADIAEVDQANCGDEALFDNCNSAPMMMAPESAEPEEAEKSASDGAPEEDQRNPMTADNQVNTTSTALPALPYHQDFFALLIYTGTMPAELEDYAFEVGSETEVYVFVPAQDAQHMIESGNYTVYLQGQNISPEADMALVVIYGEVPNA